ncbi:MAG: flagellar hook-associated protein FlgL [Clostridia bacterium]
MRVSSRMLSRQVMTNLNSLYNDLAKSHTQVSTGERFQKASEDPIRAVRSMDLSINNERNEQYLTNIDKARSVYRETEDSLMGVSDSIAGVKDNLLRGLNNTYNYEDRKVLAKEVEQLKDNIATQLNKEYSGKYYFGGYNTSEAPFSEDDTTGKMMYNGQIIEDIVETKVDVNDPDAYEDYMKENVFVKTGKSTEIGVSLPGVDVVGYGEDNLFSVLDNIIENLNTDPADMEELNDLTKKTDNYFSKVQNHISTVGAKAKNLDVMKGQADAIKVNLTDALSKESDIDIEEALMNYKTNEMVYNSALAVSAKIIQPTLIDFLR